jgi:gamma-glutamyltranspeptidase/glutathione hydrolase
MIQPIGKSTLRTLLVLCLCIVAWAPTVHAQSSQAIIRYDTVHNPAVGLHGMAVSQNRLATEVGREILQRGGNAVDAAVAMGFALAVTLPRAGNIGGSGFMLIHLAEGSRTIVLDYRSTAPLKADEAAYRDADGEVDWDAATYGARAAGVPGTVAGLYEAWRRFGSLPWADLVEPATALAASGFVVWHDLEYALSEGAPTLSKYPASSAIYLRPDGESWKYGERLVQKDLAWSLAQIAQGGADAFYRGELATRIAAAFTGAGGGIGLEDLAAYKVVERTPVATDYRGYRIVSIPPPSAGGVTLIQMLNMLKRFEVGKMEAGSAATLHLLAEVMKRAAANRRTHLGDPDFVEVPVAGYISEELAGAMAAKIDLQRAARVEQIEPEPVEKYESRDTTHYSVMDRHGNAVANTYTLGYSFGSGWVAEGTGILFDNQMRNFFTTYGPKKQNAMTPGKRMLSTMTPTIVLDGDGEVFLVTGTPGGSRIINMVLQLLVGVIDHGMGIAEATHMPRIHQGWRSQTLGIERGFSPDTVDLLEAMGHEIQVQRAMGSMQSIMYRDGKFLGAADPRRPNALALGVVYPPQPAAREAASRSGEW